MTGSEADAHITDCIERNQAVAIIAGQLVREAVKRAEGDLFVAHQAASDAATMLLHLRL